MRQGDALPKIDKLIDQTHIEQYARASGDFNPIHVDQKFAATTQFGGTIAHGMMVAAAISEMMTAAFGRDWPETGRMKIRFRSPVRPGQRVTALGTVKNVIEMGEAHRIVCSVSAVKDDGEAAIAGQAEVTVTRG
jgi:3-hydroxybutyryl-CoA dehydratase